MAQADGRIVIGTLFDADDLVKGTANIEEACKKAAKAAEAIGDKAKISVAKSVAAYNKQYEAVSLQEKKVKSLREHMEQMQEANEKYTAYEDVLAEMDAMSQRLTELRAKQSALNDTYKNTDAALSTDQFFLSMQKIENEIEKTQEKLEKLQKSKTAFEANGAPQKVSFDGLDEKLVAEEAKLRGMTDQLAIAKISLGGLANKIISTAEQSANAAPQIEKLAETTANATTQAANAVGQAERLASATAQATAQTGEYSRQLDKTAKAQKNVPGEDSSKKMDEFGGAMKKGIRALLKYGLSIRSLYMLFQKLRAAITEGINNLVQYSATANASMSSIKTSLTLVKNSLATAFQPILTAVAPAITKLCNLLAQAVTYIGLLFTALSGGTKFTKAISAQEDYAKSLAGTSAAAKEALQQLSGLDEINTWQDNTGSAGSGAPSPSQMFEDVKIGDDILGLAQKIKAAFEPIITWFRDSFIKPTQEWASTIDLSGLKESFSALGDAALPVLQQIGGLLGQIYQEVILPLVGWTAETLMPAVMDLLGSVLRFVSAVLKPVISGISALWEAIKPIVDWINEIVIQVIGDIAQHFDDLAALFDEKGSEIEDIFRGIGDIVTVVWKVVGPILNTAMQVVRTVFGFINRYIVTVIGAVIGILAGLINFMAGVFTGDWSRAWDGLKQIVDGWWSAFKKVLNVILSGINGLVSGVVKGLNAVIRALNKLHFDIPDWVPLLGGKSFGFSIREISAPRIPLLATGAVIPPNAPFAAILGDQRHGNNIETPEALLRQVVREESGGSAQYQFVAQLNRRTIFQEIIDEAKLRQASSGVNPFLLGRA